MVNIRRFDEQFDQLEEAQRRARPVGITHVSDHKKYRRQEIMQVATCNG